MAVDEETLGALLRDALEAVEVPDDGPARVLAARQLLENDKTHPGSATSEERKGGEVVGWDGEPTASRPRGRAALAILGAVAVLVVGIAVAVVGSGPSSSTKTSGASSGSIVHTAAPNLTPAAGGSSSAGAGTAGTPGLVPAGPERAATSAPPSSPPASDVPAGPSGTRLVQTGSLTLTVARGRVDATVTALGSAATGLGGSVTRSATSPDGTGTTADLTLRVPAAQFTPLVDRVETLGAPSAVTTSTTDVTSSYVDLGARIDALEATRQQFLTILGKAETISDILAVEDEITPLQSQIEQLQGQQQVLDQQSSTATLSVHVQEQAPAATPPPPGRSGLSRAWHHATHSFTHDLESFLDDLGGIAAVLVILAGLGVLARVGWRVARRRLV